MFVGELGLIYLICVCVRIVLSNTYCVVFLRLVHPMLTVSLDCTFVIAPSVLSDIYERQNVLYICVVHVPCGYPCLVYAHTDTFFNKACTDVTDDNTYELDFFRNSEKAFVFILVRSWASCKAILYPETLYVCSVDSTYSNIV